MADSVHYAISPLTDRKHPNLHVLVESCVERVLFEDKRACAQDITRTIKARKMAIISSGTFGAPAILERSGIGDPEILKGAGVPVVAEVPGVGRNYQDHYTMMYSYKSSLAPDETLDGILNGNFNIGELISKNDKIIGWNAIDATCKLRPSDADIAALGPKFQGVWDKEYQNNLNKPLAMMSLVDRWAYKMQREIARRMETYRETYEPLPVDVKDIEYTAEDDVAIEERIRENLATTWHSLGTCKMTSLKKLGVVNACLNVYGVTGLKIADLSIPSSNVAANTNNTAMVIGEKAADIFIAELGLLESN
ncbi:putative alcohol oxidase protein [Eutypa lata UCREL1]|uniref:Putative alcohol oxidase protein n=1 Tax=Eutypa lata (strain UCR-EL1) TaxID=1287681 RepID=M7TE96_EUTLA|nr:putative alcohol oxidase protein [Eutypa lata UCREL1]